VNGNHLLLKSVILIVVSLNVWLGDGNSIFLLETSAFLVTWVYKSKALKMNTAKQLCSLFVPPLSANPSTLSPILFSVSSSYFAVYQVGLES